MPEGHEPLSLDEVRKVARLARLALDDEQLERHRPGLSAVLGHARRMGELDLEGVEPLSHPMEAVNRLADDEPGPTLPTETLMRMAPETLPPFVRVPKTLAGESS